MMERLFSGIQPTGGIHIGNYLGALRNWTLLQEKYDSIFCIVDLHAITTWQEPETLKVRTRELAALLISCGIDAERSPLFVQSHVSAHAQLAWILNCVAPYGQLHRMTQFKKKFSFSDKKLTLGLFGYPVLMAAAVLLHHTDVVPVGEDQRQHIEFTRDIAGRFNTVYGKTFNLPKALIPETGARIMGICDPSNKMSKSGPYKDDAIYLLDAPDEIRSKIMKAKTDAQREIRFDESRPGVHNLLVIYQLFTGLSLESLESRFEGLGYQKLKEDLAEVIIENLRPIRNLFKKLTEDPHHIDNLLAWGAEKVRPIAERTITEVNHKIGLG